MTPDVCCLTHLAAPAALLPVGEAKHSPLEDRQPSGRSCKDGIICTSCPVKRYHGCPRSLNDAHQGSAIFRAWMYLRRAE